MSSDVAIDSCLGMHDADAILAALNATAIVATTDVQGRIRYANDRFCALSGYSRDELVGRDHRILNSGSHPLEYFRQMYRTIAAGRVWRGEICNRSKHGTLYWVDTTIVPRCGPDGTPVGYTSIRIDITDRKVSDLERAGIDARYRSTMMALGEGVVVQDRAGRIVSVNPAACRILGSSEADLLERSSVDPRWEAIREDGSAFEGVDHPAMRVLASGKGERGVLMGLRQASGQTTWISVNSEPIFEGGTTWPTAVVTSFADVTVLRCAQQVLVDAVAAIPDGMVVFDNDDRLVTCNEAYRRIYQNSPAIVPGTQFRDILCCGLQAGMFPAAGKSEQEHASWLAMRMAQHQAAETDVVSKAANGRWLRIQDRRTASGYVVGLRSDVTELKLQAARLQAMVENFPGGISVIDEDLNLIACNEQFRILLELPEILFSDGLPTLEQIFWANANRGEYGDGDPIKQVAERMSLARRAEAHHFERVRPNGVVLEIRGTPIPEGGFVTTYIDVTERKDAERRLAESDRIARGKSAVLQITLAHMSQGMSMFDASGQLQAWNDRYLDMYGMSGSVVRRGMPITEILHYRQSIGGFVGHIGGFLDHLRQEVAAGRTLRTQSTMADGRVFSVVNTPIGDGGWVATHEDITDRERAVARISHMAHHDVLTGLANRASLLERIEAAIQLGRKGENSFSVILIDLDRFKQVNDQLGHAAGDRLLQRAADRMRQQVRAGDLVARLGGDEFAILQAITLDQRGAAAALADRLVASLAEPFDLGADLISIGASIGVAMFPDHGDDIEELMLKADRALYKVKSAGRNGFCIYTDEVSAVAAAWPPSTSNSTKIGHAAIRDPLTNFDIAAPEQGLYGHEPLDRMGSGAA